MRITDKSKKLCTWKKGRRHVDTGRFRTRSVTLNAHNTVNLDAHNVVPCAVISKIDQLFNKAAIIDVSTAGFICQADGKTYVVFG